MRLNLLYPRNRLSITQWLERSVLSLSLCSVSVNQRASYRSSHWTFINSEFFENHLLLDGKIDENRVASPLSFQVVLGVLAAGSCCYTRRQFLSIFDSDSVDRLSYFASQISDAILADGDPTVGPRMRCSNGLWLDQSLTLMPSFKQILDSDYRAALNPVDFQKVENETSGLVKDLICEGSLYNPVKLVFTNALYFKGAWHREGPPPSVSDEDWPNENYVKANFMNAKREEFGRYYDDWHFLDQPFKRQSEDRRAFHLEFCYPWTYYICGHRTFVTETLMDVGGHVTPKFNISSEVEASNVLGQRAVI